MVEYSTMCDLPQAGYVRMCAEAIPRTGVVDAFCAGQTARGRVTARPRDARSDSAGSREHGLADLAAKPVERFGQQARDVHL